MTRTVHRPADAAAQAAAHASGLDPSGFVPPDSTISIEDITEDGGSIEFVELMQDEVADLKSRMGNVEHHLTGMQGQLRSIQEMLQAVLPHRPPETNPEEESQPVAVEQAKESNETVPPAMSSSAVPDPVSKIKSSGASPMAPKGETPPTSGSGFGHVYTTIPSRQSQVKPPYVPPHARRHVGSHAVPSEDLPLVDTDGRIKFAPAAILQTRSLPRNDVLVTQWLVQWDGCPPDDATWEDADFIKSAFGPFYRQTIRGWFSQYSDQVVTQAEASPWIPQVLRIQPAMELLPMVLHRFFFDFSLTYVGAGMICSHLVNLSTLFGNEDTIAIDDIQRDEAFNRDHIPNRLAYTGYALLSIIAIIIIPIMFRQVKWYYVIVAYVLAPVLGFSNAYGTGFTDMNMS
ncbi:hypothetical protein EJB05_00015, partial [Eragrostis curvula]